MDPLGFVKKGIPKRNPRTERCNDPGGDRHPAKGNNPKSITLGPKYTVYPSSNLYMYVSDTSPTENGNGAFWDWGGP